jgi:hypothetical protein
MRSRSRRRIFQTVPRSCSLSNAASLTSDMALSSPVPQFAILIFVLVAFLASEVAGRCAVVSPPTVRRRLPIEQDVRSALAGGLAGGLTNGLLHPIDCAKTLRQARPGQFTSTWNAMVSIARSRGPGGLYGGVVPAVIGAIPSSALYFGAYESIKRRLRCAADRAAAAPTGVESGLRTSGHRFRPAIHMISAASGNMVSSLIFVPKEIVKQKRQAAVALGEGKSSAVRVIIDTLGSKVRNLAPLCDCRPMIHQHSNCFLGAVGYWCALRWVLCHAASKYSQRCTSVYHVRGTKGEIAMRSFHAHGDVQIHVRRCDFWSICEHRHNANGCHQNQGGAILFSQPRTAMRSARLCTIVLWNLTRCSFCADCNRGA